MNDLHRIRGMEIRPGPGYCQRVLSDTIMTTGAAMEVESLQGNPRRFSAGTDYDWTGK